MSERNDEQFDAMLSGFFRETLEPQGGRAERGFRRYLNDVSRNAWRMRTWVIGAFATGMAASVAMLWAVPLLRPGSSSPNGQSTQIAEEKQAVTAVPDVQRVVQTNTTDEGVMVLGGGTPVHVLRRQQLEVNPKGGEQQATPDDEILIIKMPTY